MSIEPIITLTTDFGLNDEYVAVLKGVILTLAPRTRIIDITHNLPPRDIHAASRILERSCPFFPENTIHLAIVDPGVGGKRKILSVWSGSFLFIGPDNGILTPFLLSEDLKAIHKISNNALFLKKVSKSFHGRDIMAPVAAHLAMGIPPCDLGPALKREECVLLDMSRPHIDKNTLTGKIISTDRFGNLCTNISRTIFQQFTSKKQFVITVGSLTLNSVSNTYEEHDHGQPLAIFDSHDMLEIAASGGDGAEKFSLSPGSVITITISNYS